jgi:AcrR family transcriptional regulator
MPVTSRPYHHGDLRTALLDAGLALVREGGADALALREVTRSVGVSPNAAYRHFADLRTLRFAVAGIVQERLAQTMQRRRDDECRSSDRAEASVQRLRGVGLGYIEFAIAEPGWYELAILTHDDGENGAVTTDGTVPPPFAMLLAALDGMVEDGALTAERRAHAEWPCWSSVHGFADIATRGPLKGQPRLMLDALAGVVVDTVIAGLR